MEVCFFCPVCLHYNHGEDTDFIECDFCGHQMKCSGIRRTASIDATTPFVEALKTKPEFNEKFYNARIALGQAPEEKEKRMQDALERKAKREALEREARYGKQSDGEVRCPYCNSTQVQLVRRKRSLLTGFATNKVDRICVNCKRKF